MPVNSAQEARGRGGERRLGEVVHVAQPPHGKAAEEGNFIVARVGVEIRVEARGHRDFRATGPSIPPIIPKGPSVATWTRSGRFAVQIFLSFREAGMPIAEAGDSRESEAPPSRSLGIIPAGFIRGAGRGAMAGRLQLNGPVVRAHWR